MSIRKAISVKRNDVTAIVAATFPEYRGGKFRVYAAEKISIYYFKSDGSRLQYRACTLDGCPLGGIPRYSAMAPWSDPAEGQSLPLVPGACVVQHSIFCGKDMGLRIFVHPDDMPKYLTNQLVERRAAL